MTSPTVERVIAALASKKNVLLYGPPGTGKTWLLSELVAFLRDRNPAGGRPTLKLGQQDDQFGIARGSNDFENFPQNIDIEWVTFHQGYSYEDFIVGKRPIPSEGGIVLEPYFGILMSIAVRITEGKSDGCLLIIDEINRANASQVLGEFITLLDPDYRATIDGNPNANALKIRLPGISYEGGSSEDICMLREGGKFNLPEDWTFPENVYVLATMNSVDKAALPLDSALTRRFYRINMPPDLDFLAEKLDLDINDIETKIKSIQENQTSIDELNAGEVTVLLLDRLNVLISADMGEDFELGHAMVLGVADATDDDRWETLIKIWDHMLLPQLIERYAGRNQALRDVLKVSPESPTNEAFRERTQIGHDTLLEDAPIKIYPLLSLDRSKAKNILRQLAI